MTGRPGSEGLLWRRRVPAPAADAAPGSARPSTTGGTGRLANGFGTGRRGCEHAGVSRARPFVQVDVFGATDLGGNPLAVVLDAATWSEARMQAFAAELGISETTFVMPSTGAADHLSLIHI